MIPKRTQYLKWSLPTKWSFWASVIGLPLGIISFVFAILPFLQHDPIKKQRSKLLLRTAQELRYNNEWLTAVAMAQQSKSVSAPLGRLKNDALGELMANHHEEVTRHAYGENKYLYQLSIKLSDLGVALGTPRNSRELDKFNLRSSHTLHDIHFLNNFLYWYITPLVAEELDSSQLYSLGRYGFPSDNFSIPGIHRIYLKEFTNDGEPLVSFGDYLGLID